MGLSQPSCFRLVRKCISQAVNTQIVLPGISLNWLSCFSCHYFCPKDLLLWMLSFTFHNLSPLCYCRNRISVSKYAIGKPILSKMHRLVRFFITSSDFACPCNLVLHPNTHLNEYLNAQSIELLPGALFVHELGQTLLCLCPLRACVPVYTAKPASLCQRPHRQSSTLSSFSSPVPCRASSLWVRFYYFFQSICWLHVGISVRVSACIWDVDVNLFIRAWMSVIKWRPSN